MDDIIVNDIKNQFIYDCYFVSLRIIPLKNGGINDEY